MPYLMHAGRITPNNQPVPMAILARLNINGQGISGAGMNAALGIRLDAEKLKGAVTPREQGRHDLPGRHARPLDALLAGRRRDHARQGRARPW